MEKNVEAFVPRLPELGGVPTGSTATQVDAVGKVDAIGFDTPRCTICKKLGHSSDQ